MPDFTKPLEQTLEQDAHARSILDKLVTKRCVCTCGTTAVPTRCDHLFSGWREHEDGQGGEQFCQHCGLGSMAHTLRAC